MTDNQKKESLLDPVAAAAATAGAAGLANQTVQEVQKARTEGPLTFRMLGFLGGLAMIISSPVASVVIRRPRNACRDGWTLGQEDRITHL